LPPRRQEGTLMEEKSLYELLRSDPNTGMRELMKQYTGLVCAVIRARFNGFRYISTDIEDCAADTFSNFWLGFSNYDPEKASIRAYLAAIARNNAADYLKRNRLLQMQDETPWDEENDLILNLPDNSEDETAEAETRRDVIAAIKALGDPDSSILLWKYFLGRKSVEIAEKLGMTPANVDNRASRAVKKLKEAFQV